MTNEEQKLREIAYKHAEPKVIWNDGNMSIYPDEEKIESLFSDLTALISEGYVSKKEVEKMVKEKLREELIAYDKWVGEKYIDNYRHETAPAIVDEYLKSKEQ